MAGEDGFGYDGGLLGGLAEGLHGMADRLGSLRYSGDDVVLPTFALGGAGEWPARHEYGKTWDELGQEFGYGEREARTLGDNLRQTRNSYAKVESANVRRVLDAVAQARRADHGVRPGLWDGSPDSYDYDASIFEQMFADPTALSFGGGAAAIAAGAGGRLMANFQKERDLESLWHRKMGINEDVDRRIGSVGKSIVEHMERTNWSNDLNPYEAEHRKNLFRKVEDLHAERERRLSELAKLSKGTQVNVARAKAFSWTAIAGGLAWSVMVIPSDEDIDRAIKGWNALAYNCGEIFGYDTRLVRKAITEAWAGSAMEAADARLVDFIAAGVHLTERVQHLSTALSTTVEDLGGIHKAALAFSLASLAAITGLGVAARFNPALRPAVELLGTRLTSVMIVCANIAPAVTAAGLSWYKVADANRVTKIGGREVTGFRRS
ncbi:hypothetical protein ACQPYK_45160 [Streptosporangium sp. CA-135522]|uniref:hypothetical protein n=1 Tax=Streptosporangium sp. CA-135522 TaxID=3240072 RepID=UPI003D91042D